MGVRDDSVTLDVKVKNVATLAEGHDRNVNTTTLRPILHCVQYCIASLQTARPQVLCVGERQTKCHVGSSTVSA